MNPLSNGSAAPAGEQAEISVNPTTKSTPKLRCHVVWYRNFILQFPYVLLPSDRKFDFPHVRITVRENG